MPLRHFAVLTALAAPLASLPGAQAQEQSLDTLLEPLRQEYGLPALAAAVAKDGRIVAAGAVGTRMLGRDIKVTLDDRFHLGSDTKAMTATLAAMLVEEGKLRWDSTIGGVLGAELPDLHPKFAAVTLEQLLSHSGGLPSDNQELFELYASGDAYDETLPGSRLRILRAYGKHEPVVKPDAPFAYSNFGYMTAGAMIEKAAGEPWEQLIFERLFIPLGLTTAGLGPQATRGRIDAPVGHGVDDGKITPLPWGPGADVPPVMGPAGVAHMSIRDFVRWAAWNAGEGKRGPALVKAETLQRLHRKVVEMKIENPAPGAPSTGGYALGWALAAYPWSGNRPLLVHDGSNSRNLAIILVDPQNDLAITLATNFPGKPAEVALHKLTQTLYEQYGPKSR